MILVYIILEVITMPLVWRVDVLQLLKEKGYSTYVIRKDNLLPQSSVQKIREGKMISPDGLEVLCKLTKKQPGKLIAYVKEK